MSKSILLSVKPEYVVKILNGEKTIEIRKHAIPVGTKVYIYCTKGEPKVYKGSPLKHGVKELIYCDNAINGKVVASFVVGMCEKTTYDYIKQDTTVNFFNSLTRNFLGISGNELKKYSNGKTLYAWKISHLKIFGKPLPLSTVGLNRPPQSYCFIKHFDRKWLVGV